jgi:hypothetical protein
MEASYRLTIEDAVALDRYLLDRPPRFLERRRLAMWDLPGVSLHS